MSITHFVEVMMMSKSKFMCFFIFVFVLLFADSEGLRVEAKLGDHESVNTGKSEIKSAQEAFSSPSPKKLNEKCCTCPDDVRELCPDDKFLRDAHYELNYLHRYVAFGILIALFSMRNHDDKFMLKQQGFSLLAGVFSVFSLISNYLVTFWQRSFASKTKCDPTEYNTLIDQWNVLFDVTAILLMISLLFMLCLTYRYFYKENEWGDQSPKKKAK